MQWTVDSLHVINFNLQRTGKDRTPACVLARASASLAVSQLIPVLLTSSSDHIEHMVAALTGGLPDQAASDTSPSLQFFFGLGLGMLLGRLFEEHYEDVSGTKVTFHL